VLPEATGIEVDVEEIVEIGLAFGDSITVSFLSFAIKSTSRGSFVAGFTGEDKASF
jgi:hypothetical protein